MSSIKYPLRACNLSDFGEDEYGRQIFSTWNGYLILCADMENDSKYRMRGDPADMTKESWKFVVDKCSSDDCAGSEEIDQVINGLQVSFYTIERSVDFLDRQYPPIHKSPVLFMRRNLVAGSKRLLSTRLLLAKNDILFTDTVMPFSQNTFEGSYHSVD